MIAVTPMSLVAALFGMSLVGLIEPKLHVEFGISPLDGEAETSSDVSITCAISDDTVNSGSMSNYDIQRCLIYKIDGIGWTALAAISKAESTHVLLSNSKIIKAAGSIVENLNGSFIRLTWNRSNKEVYGKFRCDVEWKEYQDQSKKFSDLKISSEDKIKINSMWKASVEMLLTTELEQTIEDAIIIKMDEKVENVNNQTPERNGGDVTANVAGVENADVKLKNKISHYDKDQFFQVKKNIGSILLKSHYTKRSLLSIQDDNETLSEKYLNNIKKTLNRQIIEKASEKYNGTIPNVNMEGSLLEVLYNHTADHENKMLEHLQNITNQLQYFKAKVIPSFNVLSLLSKYKDWRLLQQISIMYERMDKREQIVKNLDQEMKKNQDLYTPADSTEFIQWPRGTFALLKSYSGCPTNPIKPQKWLEGYKRFHTESSSSVNLNSFSENIHLALPINSTQGQDHFMTLHYCVKNTSTNEEPIWPKGSYCINRYDSCSVNFTEGRFTFDEEDTSHKSSSSFITSDSLSHSALYFCCRNDGNPRDPITLPVFTPFFLYRFGGRCQSVLGMSYKEEFVYIDTENGSNGDTKQSPHADGTINNVNITLCYYEMQSS